MKNISILLVFMLVMFASCHKDTFEVLESDTNEIIRISTVEGAIAGLVYDEAKQPIANAIIDINGQLTQSDEEGLFFFTSAELDPLGSYIKAEKDGYIIGSDLVYPVAGINKSYIQMMELSTITNFQASGGGAIQIERGGSIDFGPNTISSELGGTYTGIVYVTAKRLASDDPDLGDKMPGGLIGQDQSNLTVVLGTLGMVAVELRGANGEELNLKAGSMATITFPIADKDQAFAPESIPLWYFDEVLGKWIEEGNATKQGNEYSGKVSHFSFWNCDVPFPLIDFCASIFNADGSPAQSAKVQIFAGSLGTSCGYTSNGSINGKIPKSELLTVNVLGSGPCDEILYTAEIGPFENNVKLDDIILSDIEKYTLTGQVVCDEEPIVNSVVVITGDNIRDIVQTDDQGNFEYKTCLAGEIEIFGKNLDTNEGSITQVITLNDNNPFEVTSVNTCSDCAYEAEIVVDNNTPCDMVSNLTAMVSVNGSFEYTWSNGATGPTVENIEQGEYAVTIVEESTQCEKVVTVAVLPDETYLEWSSDITHVDCITETGGEIILMVANGQTPYTFAWANKDGVSLGEASSLSNLEVGDYSFTITDAVGCSTDGTINLPSTGLDIDPPQTEYTLNCDALSLLIDLGTTDSTFTYEWSNGLTTSSLEISAAGVYILIVTNSNGCSQSFEFIVLEDFVSPSFDATLTCEGLFRSISVNNLEQSIILSITTQSGIIIPTQGNLATYHFFDFPGSSIVVTATDPSNGCQTQENIEDIFGTTNLLEVVSTTPPSCEGCNDGSIDAKIKDNVSCPACLIDIYQQTDQGEYLLVNTANDNGQLGVGIYHIALLDDMGCVSESLSVTF